MCWQRWDSFCWPRAPVSSSKPATIHLIREAFDLADADVQQSLSEPLQRLREIFGDAVRESSLQELVGDDAGHSFATWVDNFCVIQWAEIESCLGAWIANAKPEFGPEIAASFQLMKQLDRRRVAGALQRREQYFQSLHEFLGPDDLLCIPTTPALAPRKGDPPRRSSSGTGYYPRTLSLTSVAGMGRLPQVSLPIADADGRTSRVVVTREAWTGLILVASGKECRSRNKSAVERVVAAPSQPLSARSSTCVAHGQVPALTRYLRVLTFSSTTKMNTFASENGDGKDFVSHAPGYWSDVAPELWNDWKWQLKNRVTTLAQLEKHLELSDEERSGVLLSGDKLALAVTPHFFNLLPRKQSG